MANPSAFVISDLDRGMSVEAGVDFGFIDLTAVDPGVWVVVVVVLLLLDVDGMR